MGIVRQLLQIAMVEAVRGRTLAGDAVFDSSVVELPETMINGRQPLLIFSIEMGENPKGGQEDCGLLGRTSRLTMMVHSAVVSAREIQDRTGRVLIADIGETDAALEARLNILERQWRGALSHGHSPWAELFLRLVHDIDRIQDHRGSDPETGRKHASRLTELSLNVMPEPELGAALAPVIEEGLRLLELDEDAGYRELARAWRTVFDDEQELSAGAKLQARLFEGLDALAALGMTEISRAVEVVPAWLDLDVNGIHAEVPFDD